MAYTTKYPIGDGVLPMKLIQKETGDYPSVVETGDDPTVVEAGDYPTVVETGDYPTVVETGDYPTVVETGDYPTVVEAGDYPSVVETGDYPSVVETGDYPSVVETGDYPTVVETGDYPTVVEAGDYPTVVETGDYPTVVETWDYPTMVESKTMKRVDPAQALTAAGHVFGEHGGVNMSIEASATFTVKEPETMRRMFSGELGHDRDFFIYSRHFNPTVLNLGRQMAAMEGTEAAYCTSSGMSAISSVLLQLCSSGGHVVASRCLYGGTHALLAHFLPRACNVTATFVDIADLTAVKNAIGDSTKVLYLESISNPTLSVANIPALSSIAHERGVTVVVDNTFAPMLLSPARLGADVVVHSITKYVSGGADVIAGTFKSNFTTYHTPDKLAYAN